MTPRWRDRAACREAHNEPDDWTVFPEDRFHASSVAYQKRVVEVRQEWCSRCPVRVECLRDALDEDYGMAGGLSPEERKQITQLICHCGNDIDPLDMLDRNRRHYCRNCVPIVFHRTVSFGHGTQAQ